MKKVLYGICGIGNGHLYRQLPIIDYLLEQKHTVVIFTYGTAYNFLTQQYTYGLSAEKKNLLKIALVDVPYYIGNQEGLDFINTAQINSQMSMKNNLEAFSQAQQALGKPDLVISDYEPYSVQYGYAYDCPVITIDQQSKYLLKTLPLELNGFTYTDEIMRLNMFFPKAHKRLACSFFKVPEHDNSVEVIPTNIRPQIISLKNHPGTDAHYLVYLTAQSGFQQSISEMIDILSQRTEKFTVFLNRNFYKEMAHNVLPNNIHTAMHGDSSFERLLGTCNGIISTAGHTLLSEAMYLGIPVYAMPLPLYEQQLNAQIIEENQFGISSATLSLEKLNDFILNNEIYRKNISEDTLILNKESGLDFLIKYVGKILTE